MFADEVISKFIEVRGRYERNEIREDYTGEKEILNKHIAMVRQSNKFVMSPHAVTTCEQVADWRSIRKSRDYLFVPFPNTWIEWTDKIGRVAVNFQSVTVGSKDGLHPPSSVCGLFCVYLPTLYMEKRRFVFNDGYFDFPSDNIFKLKSWEQIIEITHYFRQPEGGVQKATDDYVTEMRRIGEHWDRIARTAIGAIALINTPRLSIQTHPDLAKLNRAREKRRQVPFLRYVDVDIRLGDFSFKKVGPSDRTGMMPEHDVRAHFRLRLGKLEIVSAHKRGNRKNGVIIHRHSVVLPGDKPGAWQGGPLPPPKIMRR